MSQRLERRGSEAARQRGILVPRLLLLLMIVLFALFFGALSVQQHRTYLTNGLDIGNVDQALWNTAQGRFMHFTLMAPVQSRLALHVEPILLFFVPFYWLNLGGPELLLITQALVVAIGAWPLYQLAIGNEPLSMPQEQGQPLSPNFAPRSLRLTPYFLLLIPLTYLLLPTLQSAVLFDFHAVTLAPTFLLFAFLALEHDRPRRFLLFAVLAMACKEDMPLVVIMLGVYAGLVQRRWQLAAVTICLSLVWFGLAVFVIQPRYAAEGNIQLDRYAWLGDSPAEMVVTLLTRPVLVLDHLWHQAGLPHYLAALFYPVGYLALLNPATLLPMLPTLAINLLSNNPFSWRLEDFHYGAPLAPFLLISALYAIRRLTRWASQPAGTLSCNSHAAGPFLLVLLLVLLFTFSLTYHLYRGYTPLSHAFQWPARTTHHRQLDTVLANIPAGVPLFAQSNLAPHLSQRQTIYSDFAYFTDPNFPASAAVTDIILDVSTLENIGGLHQYLQDTLLAGSYRLVAAQDGILHLTIPNQPGSPVELPPDFYSFSRPTSSPEYVLQADFGDAVRLHGYQLHFDRQEEVEVTIILEARRPLSDLTPVLYLLDSEGQPVGATVDAQPVTAWLPLDQWRVGDLMAVRFNSLPWHTRQTPHYRLALGLVSGDDPWHMGHRHFPEVLPATNLAVRLPASGSLLELADIQQPWHMPAGGPRLRQFDRPIVPQRLEANFDNQLTFLGYSRPVLHNSSQTLSITLYWQAHTVPQPLTRFVQLVDPAGQVVGQSDSAPDNGQYPTSAWQPAEVVVETVTFPVQVAPPYDGYRLHLGLYHPATGQRLPVLPASDHIEIPLP